LAATKAKVAEAQATVGERERDLARKKRLGATLAVSLQDVDQAQAAHERAAASLASAHADVAAAEAELQMNETNYAKVNIRSSINGVVLKRSVDPGQTVAASLQAPVLFTIAEDLRQMELQVDVDEADVGKVRAGQEASFSVDAFPDRRFPAVIRDVRFASETVQGVVTYKAVLEISNSELLLRPGMTATAEINVMAVKDALLVPNAALRYMPPEPESEQSRSFLNRLLPGPPVMKQSRQADETGRMRTIWVLREGSPIRMPVEIGPSDGKRTEIKGGDLKVDDRVIVDATTKKS
jgi:HlyD family secretion protein